MNILSCLVPITVGVIVIVLLFVICIPVVIFLDALEDWFYPIKRKIEKIRLVRIIKNALTVLVVIGVFWMLGMMILREIAGV